MTGQTETILGADKKQETIEMIRFLEELNQEEKKALFSFMQGVRFIKGGTEQARRPA